MNDIYKTNIKDRLEKALTDEGLRPSETARIFGFHPNYISMIRNPDTWTKCPKSAWDTVAAWINSGQSLKEYSEKHGKVLPEKHEPKSGTVISRIIPSKLHEKDETGKVMEEEEKHSVNLAEIGWIFGLQSKGKTTEQISKELKIYSKIVEKILSESTKENESIIQVIPGIRQELIAELQIRGDRLRDELKAITQLLEQYITG